MPEQALGWLWLAAALGAAVFTANSGAIGDCTGDYVPATTKYAAPYKTMEESCEDAIRWADEQLAVGG